MKKLKEKNDIIIDFENDPDLPSFIIPWLKILPKSSQTRVPKEQLDLVINFLKMDLPIQPND